MKIIFFFLVSINFLSCGILACGLSWKNPERQENVAILNSDKVGKNLDNELFEFQTKNYSQEIKSLWLKKRNGQFYKLIITPIKHRAEYLARVDGLLKVINWYDFDDPVKFYCENKEKLKVILRLLLNRDLVSPEVIEAIKELLQLNLAD